MSISEIITLAEGHLVITGLIVLVVGGLFKWIWNRVFGGKDRRSESDPQSLTKALHSYEELSETKESLRGKEEEVKDLTAALEIAQSIARGGEDLAQEAQALLDAFVAQPDDPTLAARFDGLIDDYENGPVNDLIALAKGRGAVSYMNDPRGALAAYTRVTQLSPDHKAAHNRCGNLHTRLGNLTAVQAAYDTVLTLAEAEKDDGFKAAALGNLGILADTRGDLAAAEGYYAQSLKLNQELGLKEGMANQYANLGGLEHARGKMTESRAFWVHARDLYAEIGMPHMVEKLQ
ncbi:MAG: tetratricopeptide repeat protein, partial [Paracoccaceae bacterium]